MSRINLGIALCRYGHSEVLNRPLDDVRKNLKTPWHIEAKFVREILERPECLLFANETPDDMPLEADAPLEPPTPTGHYPARPKAKSLYVPVLELGKLVAIERHEIESLRSIRNLMATYLQSHSAHPMSIAVFGSPGSGKSFAIKQIAKSLNPSDSDASDRFEMIECNVAQFRGVEDLGHVITRIASVNIEQKTPLVFFDEFDCRFGGAQLGWLKYFLAPMQDGTFYAAKQTISFGRAIFFFAGGIYGTNTDFDPFAEPVFTPRPKVTKSLKKRQDLFREQKGPDFVSRLRGHINILSVNPDETAIQEGNKPTKPVIRRALTLRGLILGERLHVDHRGCKVASIDDDVLYALLTVDNYRHGTRSMAAILQMCTPIDGVIEKASLPSRAQLNMHVDAEEFFTRVQRGRFRQYLAESWPPEDGDLTPETKTPMSGPPGAGGKSESGGSKKRSAGAERDAAAKKHKKPPVLGGKKSDKQNSGKNAEKPNHPKKTKGRNRGEK